MFGYFVDFDKKSSLKVLFAVCVVAFVANTLATIWLNHSYAASGFPVPYHVAQLSFSAEKLQSWYAQLIQLGTFKTYVQTQIIDFAFILTTLVLHPAVLMLIGRAFPADGKVRKIMLASAALSTIAPLADALENLVSFVMLAQPSSFLPFWALIYSSFAALKFAMFMFAYIVAIIAIFYALFIFFKKKAQ